MNLLELHLASFVLGFLLDLIFGDPHYSFHPVRLIGKLIFILEKALNKKELSPFSKRFRGLLLVLLVCLFTESLVILLLFFAFKIHKALFFALESLMNYQLFAAKSLKTESLKVYFALKNKNILEARKALSMIVGRDTQNLLEEEIIKASVETVAENTSDGVIAPLIFCALGGPALGFLYKCINTMDSMIAYKNQRFLDFGRAAARLDDGVNFIPSRLSAFFMILSCAFLGKDFSFKNAVRIFKRDRFKHQSPNSAQTESVMAGALGLKLAGPAFYEGKLEEKPFIGDSFRPAEISDIKRAIRLMYAANFLCFFTCLLILALTVFFRRVA